MINHKLLAHIVSRNINALCQTKTHAKKNLAELCAVSPALVTKWTATDNPIIPRVEYLVTIAKYFNVEVEWLLTDHKDYKMPEHIQTYSDAFVALIYMTREHIIETESIKDPILKYLVTRYWEILEDEVNEYDFKNWQKKIVRDFDIPITEYHNDISLHNDIIKYVKGIAAINLDEKYRNLAKSLNNPELIKKLLDETDYIDI